MAKLDTGDIILHTPTGAFWVVAINEGHRLTLCGWPLATAEPDHCKLFSKAGPETRLELLHDLARLQDRRGEYARAELSRASDPD
jgi:hypothetical protein